MKKFNYKIFWSAEDSEYVAICDEFEMISYLDSDPRVALAGLLEVIKDIESDKCS